MERNTILELKHQVYNALLTLNNVNEKLEHLYEKHMIADGFKSFKVVSEGVYYEFFTQGNREGTHLYWVVQSTDDTDFCLFDVYEMDSEKAYRIIPNTIYNADYDSCLYGITPVLYKGESPFQAGDTFFAKPVVTEEFKN